MKDDNQHISDNVIDMRPFLDSRDYPGMISYQIQFDKNATMINKGRPYRFLLLLTFVHTVTLEEAKERMSTLVKNLHDHIFECGSTPDENLVRGVAIVDIRHEAHGTYEVWLALKDYPELPRDDEEAAEEIFTTLADRYACLFCHGRWDQAAPFPVEVTAFPDPEDDKSLIQKLTSDGGAEPCVFQVGLNGLT